jgi:hypothetical protein
MLVTTIENWYKLRKMAKLSPESKQLIINLKNRLLDIVDESKAVEFAILNRFGETAETLDSLEQLTEIALQAESRFSQLSNLEIRAAQSQPMISPDLLRFIEEVIKTTQVPIPALMRSVEEIKLEWS